jgi:hypothetical protein
MIPTVPAVLADLAGLVARNAAPDISPVDRGSALGLSSMLLGMAAEVWDGAAHKLVEENRALRRLLAQGPLVGLDFDDLIRTNDEDLRLSALQSANAELRAGLIDLHAAAEKHGSDIARALEAAIWIELSASTERRRLAGSPV